MPDMRYQGDTAPLEPVLHDLTDEEITRILISPECSAKNTGELPFIFARLILKAAREKAK